VRRMRASISLSIRQLTANAAPASNQMPAVAGNTTCQAGKPPSVARNMPITAQNTASWVTRGLVRSQYWRHFGMGTRAVGEDGADGADIATLCRDWPASSGAALQACEYRDQGQQQQGSATIVRDRHREWQAEHYIGNAQGDLQYQQQQ